MNNAFNNALNLFPTTQTPQQTQTKLRNIVYHATLNARGPTEIQSTLAYSLYDDSMEYLNTLEMNRAASYTFGYHNSYGQNGTTANELGGGTHGESIASEMWELALDWTLSQYTQHSVLAITKTISLIQHVLLHGSEACVMNGELLYKIEMAVEPLRNLNTALAEAQMVDHILNNEGRATGENDIVLSTDGIGHQLAQLGTKATATMLKLKGGSVDKGYPVRTAASKLYGIVSVPINLRQMRMQQQQQQPAGSLVPIGSTNQVGYITDEGRYRLLQQKMAAEEKALKQKQWQEQQRLKQTKSNLAGASATDSFGGGYASSNNGSNGGKVVVGAAHSLEDMIKTAKYELEQHKSKQQQKISSLKKGYSDDPMTRARQLEELQRSNVGDDPDFSKKEKALQDALEYLEEMQQLEQEKVSDLLEGDLLGNTNASGVMANNYSASDDLLGFSTSTTAAATSQIDVFGVSAPMASNVGAGGGSADLLGFNGLTSGGVNCNVVSRDAFSPQPMPVNSMNNLPSSNGMMNAVHHHTPATMNGGGSMANNPNLDFRPSLVTGMRGETGNNANNSADMPGSSFRQLPTTNITPNFSDIPHNDVSTMSAMGGVQGTLIMNPLQQEMDEEAEAENSRKMQMAAGIFAGVVPASQQQKPIMQSGNSSNISALDELISVSEPPSAPPPTAAFDTPNDTTPLASMPTNNTFGMGPMGGSSNQTASTPPAPPIMAPPPPPTEAPPPPPPPPPQVGDSLLGNNPTVEQMQEMIRQQQAQMNQMMQMMAQMQPPNGGGG